MLAFTKARQTGDPWAILDLSLRLVMGTVFLVSAIAKLAEPQPFAVIIDAYGILPELLVMPTALALPVLELVAAIGLVMDKRGGLELMTLLMVIFMAVLAYGIFLGLDVDCGCFGPDDPEGKAFHGLRSALFEQCAEHSAHAAGLAAALIIEAQPERIAQADWDYLEQRDTHLKARLKIVGDLIRH